MTLIQRLQTRKDQIALARAGIITDWFSKIDRSNDAVNQLFHKLLEQRKIVTTAVPTIPTGNAAISPLEVIKLLLNQLKAEVDVIKEDNKITIKETIEFSVRAMRLFKDAISQFNFNTLDTKESVLLAFDEFYAKVLAPLDIPYIPKFIEDKWVDPFIGTLLHEAIDGLYDSLFTTSDQPAN